MNINGKWYTEPQIEAYVTELENKVAELEAKHWNECRQIAHYSDENAKLKELLRKAVEVINREIPSFTTCEECNMYDEETTECNGNAMDKCSEIGKWRYAAEALALIGEGTNVPASADDTNVGHKSGGWISCEERLPEESGTYICAAKSAGRNIVTFVKWQPRYKQWDLTGARSYWQITHWQPLPEPPKE